MRQLVLLLVLCLACLMTIGWSASAPPADDELIDIGFDEAPAGTAPDGWFMPMQGWSAEHVDAHGDARPDDGAPTVRLTQTGESTAPFGNLMRSLPADGLAGFRVELTARIKVTGEGRAQMWLRADRPDGKMGAFDNMSDRPIRAGEWTEARIVAEIDRDADSVNIGVMALGGATVLIASPTLMLIGEAPPEQAPSAAAPLDGRSLENVVAAARLLSYLRFFHPSDQCVGVTSWDHVALALVEAAEPARDAADLAERLRNAIADIAPTVALWAGEPDAPPDGASPAIAGVDDAPELRAWRHRGAGSAAAQGQSIYSSAVQKHSRAAPPPDLDLSPVVVTLGGGVSMHMPIAVVADHDGTLPHGTTPDRWIASDTSLRLSTANRTTRLASVALCWGVFQHFYPYFDVVEERFGVDWAAALPQALREAAEADGPAEHRDCLRRLVAKLHDGHGRVDGSNVPSTPPLPIQVEWAGDDLVVVKVNAENIEGVHIGDAIVAVDGRPIDECHAELATRISAGTEGYLRWISSHEFVSELATEDPAVLTLRGPDGVERSAQLNRRHLRLPPYSWTVGRIANGAPVGDPDDGIVYFDLRGAAADEFVAHIHALATAKAIIFDVRGYPDGAAMRLLGHLITEPAQSARWLTPIVHRPDREGWTWDESGRWRLVPLRPHLDQPIAFLTDGSAISYAESIMGVVEHERLGEIVGAPTAGANGNVNPFKLPGGDFVTWTGMKVLKHDGGRHHTVGILPTVPIAPTQKGIADGRDEVLEKAVEVLKAKLAES